MKRSSWILLSLILIAGVLLSACGAPTVQPPTPATQALITEAPTLAIEPLGLPAGTLEVTLWHPYTPGSIEEKVLSEQVGQAENDLPNIRINLSPVPAMDIFNEYRAGLAADSAPDLFIAPNASLGENAREGLIADITDAAAGRLDDYSQLSIQGMLVDDRLYGIPESLEAVVFWYNKDLLATPPTTTDELKALMQGGTEISISFGCFHQFGFYHAFGGRIFDESWKVVANQDSGVSDAMAYLNDLYQISKANGWPRSDADGLLPFTEGDAAAITNGNWALSDYRNALGDKLGVAPLPAGPKGPATPFLSVDGFYFSPNTQNLDAAIQVALYLTGKEAEEAMMNEAGHVPANTTVTVTDPLIRGLLDAFRNSYIRPQVPQGALYWTNFCTTGDVFEGGMSAVDWVNTATVNANK